MLLSLSQPYLQFLKFLKHRPLFPANRVFIHRVSASFPSVKESFNPKSGPGNSLSSAHQLMLDYGIISYQHNGLFVLLPLGFRALDKLVKLLDTQMRRVNGQKLSMPSLTSASLWEKSGRMETCGKEVMTVCDRHKHTFILSPTHEEPITKLVSQADLSPSSLPLRLYQISSKFRDESRPKHGLLRGREFLMKDMYTFDETVKDAEDTFEKICKIYSETFGILKIPFKEVDAPVGMIGGIKSHEFHVLLGIGEDTILSCQTCNYSVNSELVSESNSPKCPNCKENLISVNGIEVGHAFLLGTKYSSPFSAKYRSTNSKLHLLQMGCYGIGVTRLLSATLECLVSSKQLIWPSVIAPYKVCLIPPKKGSKEFHCSYWCDHLEHFINKIPGYEDEVIVDDRINQTIGRRFNEAKNLGYPIVIIIGKKSNTSVPHFEVFFNKTNQILELTQLGVLECLREVETRENNANKS